MCVIARDKNNDILAIPNNILRKCRITFLTFKMEDCNT